MKTAIVLAAAGASLASAQRGCAPVHFVYARATTEVPTGIKQSTTPAEFTEAASKWWSLGYGAAGGGLWLNLTDPRSPERIDGISGYPVPYPADSSGAGGAPLPPGQKKSSAVGIDLMIAELKEKAATCTKQKFVLGGHSQGGAVTVGAINKMVNDSTLVPPDTLQRIIAVTMFGSPPCPAAVRDRCMSYCHKGDFACDPAAKGNTPPMPGAAAAPGAAPPNITPGKRDLMKRDYPKECPKDVKEAGYLATAGPFTGTGPHLSYNSDGYYIKAAACYINEKFKAVK